MKRTDATDCRKAAQNPPVFVEPRKSFAALALAALMPWSLDAGEPGPFTSGEIRLLTNPGGQQIELRYRLKNARMRIDRPGEIIPAPPVNLLDLKTGNLRILHPHNGTWNKVPAESLRPQRPGRDLPTPPPGIGPWQGPEITPPGQPGRPPVDPAPPDRSGMKPRIGPDLPGVPAVPDFPEMPARPAIPSIPGMPATLPPGLGSLPGGAPGGGFAQPEIPRISESISRIFPGRTDPLELKPADEKRVIHGYECTRHIVTIPREGELILWLTAPGMLPPFHLLLDDVPPTRQRPDWAEQIPALLREKDLFPLLAIWKREDGGESTCWEVTRIGAGEEDGGIFEVPESYYQLERPVAAESR